MRVRAAHDIDFTRGFDAGQEKSGNECGQIGHNLDGDSLKDPVGRKTNGHMPGRMAK
jgi:hypothetical protein